MFLINSMVPSRPIQIVTSKKKKKKRCFIIEVDRLPIQKVFNYSFNK